MVQIEVLKKIHSSDIKDGVIYRDKLYTVGRDRTIRITALSDLSELWSSEDLGAVVNSICIDKEVVYIGLQTGELLKYKIEETEENIRLKTISREHIHKDNICSLSLSNEGIISTSWDRTIGIIREDKTEIVKIESIAWSAKKLEGDTNTIIAGCIDGSICTLKKNTRGEYEKSKGLKIHSTCIRDILMNKSNYVSVSNTGVVVVSEYTGKTIYRKDLNNTTFRVNRFSDEEDGYIVASDEGMVYVLNEKLENLFSIAVPALSCWSAVSHQNKIIIFGSDGRVYVFGDKKSEKYQKILEELQDEINKSKSIDAKEENSENKIEGDEKPQYKVVDNQVYVMKDGEWELYGSTVEKKKKDHTITITLGDSNYSLSFDKTEKYEDVAYGFVKENNLGTEYIPEIVEFLNKNFSKKTGHDLSKYILYDTIEIEAVKKRVEKLPNGSAVIDFITEVESQKSIPNNHSDIEVILSEWLEEGTEKIAVLDIYKYLIAKHADFDLFFLKNLDVLSCRKTALIFSMIATNVLAVRPESKPLVDSMMTKIMDKQLIGPKIIQNYKHNRRV